MNRTIIPLIWRRNPDEENSYLAEFKTPNGDVQFEVVKAEKDNVWSYAYILPWVEDPDYPNFFDHDFLCDTMEDAKEEAEYMAWRISVGDE